MAEPADNLPPEDAPEITIESVVETPVEDLNDDQKTFIQENADSLTNEQKETYKDVLEAKEDANPPEIPDPEERKPGKKDDTPPPPSDDEDDDLDEKKTIGKVVDEKLKPLSEALGQVQRLKDEAEVDG